MRETERVKLHKETRLEYMTYLMELNHERRKAYKEGETKERLNSIRNFVKATKWSIDKAMEALEIPMSERDTYKEKILAAGL